MINRLFSLTLVLFFSLSLFSQNDIEAGKALFQQKCTACHNIDMKTRLVGPPLAGVYKKWKKSELYEWVRNPQSLLDKGHKYATKLFKEYNNVPMLANPNLSNADIENIFAFIENVASGAKTSVVEEKIAEPAETEAVTEEQPVQDAQQEAVPLDATQTEAIAEVDINAGKEFFKAKCAACHAMDMKTRMTGPGLGGAEARWTNKAELYSWIKNPQQLLDAKHEYASKLFEEFNKVPMIPSPDLKDQDIANILAYIDNVYTGGGTASTSAKAPTGDIAAGKEFFLGQCAACHAKDMKTKMTGPALENVLDRWPNKDELYSWVRNSQKLIGEGHEYGAKLFETYGKVPMPPYENLSNTDIDNILAYIYDVTKPAAKEDVATSNEFAEDIAAFEIAEKAAGAKWLYWVLAIVAFLGSLFAFYVSANKKYKKELEAGSSDMKKPNPINVLFSKAYILFLLSVLMIGGGFMAVPRSVDLGRQQGYQPIQPIKFSHKIHAGLHKIDCEFCHDGARRSKHSVIPSTNTCMLCHKAIQNGSRWGKEEIGKIYASAGYNPDKGAYDSEGTGPIEWVRIHSLPDHVYFNHSQHVTAGQLECQTCHGPIEEMHIVKQYSPLSMAWCVNCHRETEVQFEDNEYYESYEKLHQDIKEGKIDKVTVEDIGGIECQKCHY